MISKFCKIFALIVLVSACSPKENKLSELIFVTSDGEVTYQVETAATKEEMSQGLMNRKELKEKTGMIFVLQGQKEIAMWMKDTYIPLDMLFVNQDGQIVWIYKNAQPMSTRLIRPQTSEMLSAVIEVNAGELEKNNIRVGDLVKHKAISK